MTQLTIAIGRIEFGTISIVPTKDRLVIHPIITLQKGYALDTQIERLNKGIQEVGESLLNLFDGELPIEDHRPIASISLDLCMAYLIGLKDGKHVVNKNMGPRHLNLTPDDARFWCRWLMLPSSKIKVPTQIMASKAELTEGARRVDQLIKSYEAV